MSRSSRARCAEVITPLLPEKWQRRVNTHTVATIGTLAGPSVFIDYVAISHDGMPPGQLIDEFEIGLVSHLTDYALAEDELDETAKAFVRAIDPRSDIAWTGAAKKKIADKYLGWVVTVQLLTPESE